MQRKTEHTEITEKSSTKIIYDKVYLDKPIIYYPKTNTIYYFPMYPNKNNLFALKIKGEDCPHFYYINLVSFTGVLMDERHKASKSKLLLNCQTGSFIPNVMITSVSDLKAEDIPLIMYCNIEKNSLTTVKRIKWNFYNPILFHLSIKMENSIRFESADLALEKTIQKDLPSTLPVNAGKLPIYLKKSKPSVEFLNNLYQRFLDYNSDARLQYQYDKSFDKCYVRAHLINILLSMYGIQSIKIYKIWRPQSEEWKTFGEYRSWNYHCAAAPIDDQMHPWIFDPWVGFNRKLLTPREWIMQEDEPEPLRVTITNQFVTCDVNGEVLHSAQFFSLENADYVDSFQAVAASAIPNPPERPLARFSIFVRNEEVIIEGALPQPIKWIRKK